MLHEFVPPFAASLAADRSPPAQALIVSEDILIILSRLATEVSMSPNEMARVDRRSLRPVRTRGRLVRAARRIIAQRGNLEAVPIEEIAGRANVATGSFYNHFASKAELFEAAVAEAAREHAALLTELMAGIDDSAVGTMRIVREDPIWGALAIRTGIYVDELWRALGADLEQAIRLGVESGRFVASDIPTTVAAIAGASFGVMKSTLEGRLPDDADSLLAEQILHVLGLSMEEAHAIAFAPLPEATRPAASAKRGPRGRKKPPTRAR
jgi:AcrR family transcriptional regulator